MTVKNSFPSFHSKLGSRQIEIPLTDLGLSEGAPADYLGHLFASKINPRSYVGGEGKGKRRGGEGEGKEKRRGGEGEGNNRHTLSIRTLILVHVIIAIIACVHGVILFKIICYDAYKSNCFRH